MACGRAAGGQHVVDDRAPAPPGVNGVLVHLDGGGPVLELVALRVGGSGQLPCLRTGTKPEPSWQATEAARMKPRASIPTTLSTGPCPPASALTTAGERLAVSQQRGDVLEHDARLRVVGDVADP